MEYRSPLGMNFRLSQSIAAAAEKEKNETPRKPAPDFVSSSRDFSMDSRQMRGKGNPRKSHERSPNFGHFSNTNRNSPNHGKFDRNTFSASQYYHPSMVEDPWQGLESRT